MWSKAASRLETYFFRKWGRGGRGPGASPGVPNPPPGPPRRLAAKNGKGELCTALSVRPKAACLQLAGGARRFTSLPWWRSAAALAAARYTHVSGRVRLINSCPLAFCKLHPLTRPQLLFQHWTPGDTTQGGSQSHRRPLPLQGLNPFTLAPQSKLCYAV